MNHWHLILPLKKKENKKPKTNTYNICTRFTQKLLLFYNICKNKHIIAGFFLAKKMFYYLTK